jgi:hypothetical protein
VTTEEEQAKDELKIRAAWNELINECTRGFVISDDNYHLFRQGFLRGALFAIRKAMNNTDQRKPLAS